MALLPFRTSLIGVYSHFLLSLLRLVDSVTRDFCGVVDVAAQQQIKPTE
jgi:hypothetical protein